jgi:hypothetical protein
VANPVAGALLAQAHELALESGSCRKDAAAWREQHPDSPSCDSGVVQIGLSNAASADRCVPMIIKAVPSCDQWDEHYRIMAGADRAAGAPLPRGVALMESAQFGAAATVAGANAGGDGVHEGE